ncbi:MAG: hypothetical protein ACUVX9_09030 [Anaerolineae bacterium]
MSFGKMFDLGGLNLWIVASGNGLNLILEGMVFLGAVALGMQGGGPAEGASAQGSLLAQAVLMLGSFLGPALVAFICGRMEGEMYQKYALYTLPGNLILTVPSIVFGGGIMGIMLVVVAVLGALNGARLAEMTATRHSR